MIPDWVKLKPVNNVTANNTGGAMITQEMVEVGLREATEQASSYNVSITQYALEQMIYHTLNAVYPLILEQAAGVCEAEKCFSDSPSRTGAINGCIDAIRNLKEVPNSKS